MRVRRRLVPAAGALVLAVGLVLGAPAPLPARAAQESPAATPSLFGIRLEGYAVRTNAFTTASSANPGSGYSFAKIDSNPGYDGGRQLEMKVVATNNDPGDLGGAVVFSADSPLNGSNLPGYADAYFPTFEGYSQISEKCAVNNANREAPECRDQPGAYVLAQVVPDQDAPHALGVARNTGDGEQGQTVTRSEIGIDETGAIVALQDNRGDDQQVPETPITVDFVATATVTAALDGVQAAGSCTADVRVGEQPITSDDQLQQALGPFTAATGVRVDYVPPTAAAVVETGDGGREVSCTGARFTVSVPAQGESGVTYTYGRTFAASSRPDNPSYGAAAPELPTPTRPSTGSAPRTVTPVGTSQGPVPTNVQPAAPITPTAGQGGTGGAQDPVSFIARRLDTAPLALWTAVAAVLLPAGVWMLLGVTGSLGRGLPRLRLPPFPR